MSDLPESVGVDDFAKNEGATLYLKIDYKVLLLVLVVFDVFHVSLGEFVVRVFGP